jgi:hypothetical protein
MSLGSSVKPSPGGKVEAVIERDNCEVVCGVTGVSAAASAVAGSALSVVGEIDGKIGGVGSYIERSTEEFKI